MINPVILQGIAVKPFRFILILALIHHHAKLGQPKPRFLTERKLTLQPNRIPEVQLITGQDASSFFRLLSFH